MRTYVIDDLSPETLATVSDSCTELGLSSSIEGVFWLPVADSNLTPLQQEHKGACGPFVMALTIEEDALILELLVRSRNTLHCDCICYASPALRTHMMQYVDGLVDESAAP
jgi:hypothetical protein